MYDPSARAWQYWLGKDPPIGGNGVLRKSMISANLGYIYRLAVFIHNSDDVCWVHR